MTFLRGQNIAGYLPCLAVRPALPTSDPRAPPQIMLRQLGHKQQRQGIYSGCGPFATRMQMLCFTPLPPHFSHRKNPLATAPPSPQDPPARPAPLQGYCPGAAAPAPAPASGCAARTGAAGRSSCHAARATWRHGQGREGGGAQVEHKYTCIRASPTCARSDRDGAGGGGAATGSC